MQNRSFQVSFASRDSNINKITVEGARIYIATKISCTDGCISDICPRKKARQSHQITRMEAKLKRHLNTKYVPWLSDFTKQRDNITEIRKVLCDASQSMTPCLFCIYRQWFF